MSASSEEFSQTTVTHTQEVEEEDRPWIEIDHSRASSNTRPHPRATTDRTRIAAVRDIQPSILRNRTDTSSDSPFITTNVTTRQTRRERPVCSYCLTQGHNIRTCNTPFMSLVKIHVRRFLNLNEGPYIHLTGFSWKLQVRDFLLNYVTDIGTLNLYCVYLKIRVRIQSESPEALVERIVEQMYQNRIRLIQTFGNEEQIQRLQEDQRLEVLERENDETYMNERREYLAITEDCREFKIQIMELISMKRMLNSYSSSLGEGRGGEAGPSSYVNIFSRNGTSVHRALEQEVSELKSRLQESAIAISRKIVHYREAFGSLELNPHIHWFIVCHDIMLVNPERLLNITNLPSSSNNDQPASASSTASPSFAYILTRLLGINIHQDYLSYLINDPHVRRYILLNTEDTEEGNDGSILGSIQELLRNTHYEVVPLKQSVLMEDEEKEWTSSFECPVCYENVDSELVDRVVMTNCSHKFCYKCISQAILSDRTHKKCPCCRTKVTELTYKVKLMNDDQLQNKGS